MITLEKINGKTLPTWFSSYCDIQYLGAEWGDSNVTENSKWSSGNATPIFQPIDSAEWTDATFKFLIVPTTDTKAEGLETGISLLASLFRDKRYLNGCIYPEADFGAYKFGGHCTAVDVTRIGRDKAAEVSITMQGFKYVEETIDMPSTSTAVCQNVTMLSPMRITFDVDSSTAYGTINLYFNSILGDDENALEISALPVNSYVLDGRTKTFTEAEDGTNYSEYMGTLYFPSVPAGGLNFYGTGFGDTSNVVVTVYRRIL